MIALDTLTPLNEVLPVRGWADILGVSRQAVYSEVPLRGEEICISDLPERWQAQVAEMLRAEHLGSVHQLLSAVRHVAEPARAGKAFAAKPEASRRKALLVREVMTGYFRAVEAGTPDKEAVPAACERWADLFGKPCSEKTIRRKRDQIMRAVRPGKTVHDVSLETYCDNKDVPHHAARLENKGVVPPAFVKAFRAKCVDVGCEHVSSAFRSFEIAWLQGEEVPGFGFAAQPGRTPFPVKLSQMRKYQPGRAARLQGNRGKAAAVVAALPTIQRSHAEMMLCEQITFDDTRSNMYALDDLTGRVVELKLYFAMDVATRRIVGWLIREAGGVKATDVDALVARVLQSWGFAHKDAGYKTTLKFERGCVACSPAKQVILEGLYPGQIRVSRTGMDGGRNGAGDYQQAASGHWFGKGEIESFMRTLAFYTEHLKGQRGGVWQRTPAQLGTVTWREDGTHLLTKGSMLDEAAIVATAGRGLALMTSGGLDTAPSAAEAAQRFGLHNPLYYVHELVAVMPSVIAYYNNQTEHRREGFADVRMELPEGGIRIRKESSEERAARLLAYLQARGIAPVVMPDADVTILLHRARTVTVTRNGVNISLGGTPMRFFAPGSAAVREAMHSTTLERTAVALFDEENPDRIHLLKNAPGTWKAGDTTIYWETLPYAPAAPTTNRPAMQRAMEATRREHNAVAREVEVAYAPILREREEQRQSNLDTLRSVTVAHGGLRHAAPGSDLARQISEDPGHVVEVQTAPEATTREEQRAAAAPSYAQRLAAMREQLSQQP